MKEKLWSQRFNKSSGNYCYGRLYIRMYHVEHKLLMQSDTAFYYMLMYEGNENNIYFIVV